jgi:uncharacterized protein YndB with AHSA1/START domain
MKELNLPIGRGKVGYTTSHVIRQPLSKVWDAVTQKKHLKKYFIDDMRGEFGPELETVSWIWKKEGHMPFYLTKFEKHKRIEFTADDWTASYRTKVTFEFEKKGRHTIFRVHDTGYKQKDLKFAFMMCEGWTEFHTYLKAYLKWGVDVMRKA